MKKPAMSRRSLLGMDRLARALSDRTETAPDRRAQATARRHGIDISGYRGRQVSARDFHRFTHILALDHANLDDLRALRPRDATARLSLLLDHVPGQEGEAVADPYWGNETGFDTTWAEVSAAAEALVAKLQARS